IKMLHPTLKKQKKKNSDESYYSRPQELRNPVETEYSIYPRAPPAPSSFIPRPFIGVHRQRSSDFEPSVGPTDRLKSKKGGREISPWRVSTVGYFSYWIETVEQCTRLCMGDYDKLSFCKTVHCSQFLVCPQQATMNKLRTMNKNRHERLCETEREREREKENSHSTCCRETISEFSSDSEVSGVPMPVRRGLKETHGIGSYPLVCLNHGRYRRVNNNVALPFVPIALQQQAVSIYTHCTCGFIDNKSQVFAVDFNARDFKNHDARKRSLALSHSPLISIINDLRVSGNGERIRRRKRGKRRAPIYDRARTLRGAMRGGGRRRTHGGPLSHFLSGSRVPPVISHYALATNGDANSVSATAASLESGKKGGGRGRKNGPFNGLIDLLPRRPTVVTARNENVTLYRHLEPATEYQPPGSNVLKPLVGRQLTPPFVILRSHRQIRFPEVPN
ncbi:hypothetical protein ALC56_03178, partial [Trachymyrmex septentrionalis]